ncbi:hypothetical protein CC2G_009838 [Coprinopsis cinerea AmutBmut pab1-1]|nr:hypothetical protein CC2G_009838 [Coprinopsis cinerea AmutBmut pab1-1]
MPKFTTSEITAALTIKPALLSSFTVPDQITIAQSLAHLELLRCLENEPQGRHWITPKNGGHVYEYVDVPGAIEYHTSLTKGRAVRALPNEVLAQIFSYVEKEDVDGVRAPYKNYSLVCKKWYTFVRSHAPLWNRLKIDVGRMNVKHSLLKSALLSSKNTKLEVTLETSPTPRTTPMSVEELRWVPVLCKSRDRWTSLCVTGTVIKRLTGLRILGPDVTLANVHELTFISGEYRSEGTTPRAIRRPPRSTINYRVDRLIGKLPLCTTVHVVGTCGVQRTITSDILADSVTSLSFNAGPQGWVVQMPYIVDYLRRGASRLERVVLGGNETLPGSFHPRIVEPQQDIRVNSSSIPIITMAKLRVLELSMPNSTPYLRFIRTPALEELTLTFGDPYFTAQFGPSANGGDALLPWILQNLQVDSERDFVVKKLVIKGLEEGAITTGLLTALLGFDRVEKLELVLTPPKISQPESEATGPSDGPHPTTTSVIPLPEEVAPDNTNFEAIFSKLRTYAVTNFSTDPVRKGPWFFYLPKLAELDVSFETEPSADLLAFVNQQAYMVASMRGSGVQVRVCGRAVR